MKKVVLFLWIIFSFSLIYASDFKLYPNAMIDEKSTKEAQQIAQAANELNAKITIYTTKDSFQDVALFYKSIAKEFIMPRTSGTSGKPKKSDLFEGDLWEAFFIFDGAKDLSSSKLWIKVQRPYIGEEIQDVTVIILKEKK